MGSKKAKKDCKTKSHTSPRKRKTTKDADPEEESQEQSQEQSQELNQVPSEPRDELPEGDAAGDKEKTEKVGTVWTPEEDEQIAAFFEDNTMFYDMVDSEYKNKKK